MQYGSSVNEKPHGRGLSSQVKSLQVVDKDNGVRVSHRNTAHRLLFAVDCQGSVQADTVGVARQRRWHLRTFKDRRAHVNFDQTAFEDLRNDRSRPGVDSGREGRAGAPALQLRNKLRHAPAI